MMSAWGKWILATSRFVGRRGTVLSIVTHILLIRPLHLNVPLVDIVIVICQCTVLHSQVQDSRFLMDRRSFCTFKLEATSTNHTTRVTLEKSYRARGNDPYGKNEVTPRWHHRAYNAQTGHLYIFGTLSK